jgi:hypothetical protein
MLQIQARGGIKSPIKINKHLSCEDFAPCRGTGALVPQLEVSVLLSGKCNFSDRSFS